MNNVNDIKEWLKVQLSNSDDVVFRTLRLDKNQVDICFITSICDSESIHNSIMRPFFDIKDIGTYQSYLLSLPKCSEVTDKELILNQILHGSVAIFFEHEVLMYNAKNILQSSISDSLSESVTQGPKDNMQESIDTNLNLIRHRYHQKSLTIEQQQLGKEKIPIVILYDNQLADFKVLDQLNLRLEKLYSKSIHSVQQIHRDLMKETSPLVPTIMLSDRADRIVKNIEDGKVIMIVQGSPYALILPTVFFDFITSMDDYYQLPMIGIFFIILRYISLALRLVLPGFYVGTTSYNPEIYRYELAVSITSSRMNIPYQSYIELLFMLIMTELLVESSARMPRGKASVSTTVGGLILGQAAVAAGLASNIMVIIVSVSAIVYYIMPISSMNSALRILKYPIIILSIFYGLIGVIIGFIGIVFYLANLRSFGRPYLQLFSKK